MNAPSLAGPMRSARSLARRLALACGAVLTLCAGASAAAQSDDEVAGFLALSYTPIGALTPTAPMNGAAARPSGSRFTFQGRYGRLSPSTGLSNNTIGAGIELPAGRWTLGGTLAYLAVSCTEDWEDYSDCDSDVMVGGIARRTLLTRPMGARARHGAGAQRQSPKNFVVGFEASGGYSPRQGEHAIAFAIGVPAGVAIESDNMRVVPFLTPGIGYGRLSSTQFDEDEASTSYASTRFMVGGGVGIQFNSSGIGATLGFQKILVTGGGGTALGLSMSWQGASRSR